MTDARTNDRRVTPVKYADEAAFPRPEFVGPSLVLPTQWGLTKRELFAAMAMQGLCAEGDTFNAKKALECADALLAALGASNGR